MFCKGDKIVYPMYGAGIIEALEEKEIDGNTQIYYVLNISIGNLTIMIPEGKVKNLGIREIYEKDEVLSVLGNIYSKPINMPENWNERYKFNLEKVKTGALSEVAEVYRNLYLRERDKGLSGIEKKLLSTAKQIILSELVLSQNIDKRSAEETLVNTMQDLAEPVEA